MIKLILLSILTPFILVAQPLIEHNRAFELGHYEDIYLEMSHSLQASSTPEKKINALFERALALFFLGDCFAACQDLNEIEAIASSLSVSEFLSKPFRTSFTEVVWFRLALAAAERKTEEMFHYLELIKVIDDSYPNIIVDDYVVKVIPKENGVKNSSFIEMLKGLKAISSTDQASYDENAIWISYPDFYFIPKPLDYLKKIEIAAARSFCSSHWAEVSWEFIGKSVNPEFIWTYFSFGEWHHRLLKNVEKNRG